MSKEFEEWYISFVTDRYEDNCERAWNHQQERIDELETQNKILIETLKFILLNSTGINDKAKFKAEETLEQVGKLNKESK